MAFEPKEKVVYIEGQHLNPLDDALLAIIKLRDGAISISEVSAMMGVSKENLTASIERLQRLRLIERSSETA